MTAGTTAEQKLGPAGKRLAGFTLIEVLLATSLLAMLLALLFSTLTLGGRFWSRTEERIETLLGYWTLERFLHNTLSRAKLWTVEGETFGLEGKRDRLTFASTLPYAIVLKGPQRFELYRKGRELRVKVRSLGGEDVGGEAQRDVVLLEGVKEIEFRYFGRDPLKPDDSGSWHDSWSKDYLPLLVEITIKGEKRPLWPPMVVAVRQQAGGVRRGFPIPNRPLMP